MKHKDLSSEIVCTCTSFDYCTQWPQALCWI